MASVLTGTIIACTLVGFVPGKGLVDKCTPEVVEWELKSNLDEEQRKRALEICNTQMLPYMAQKLNMKARMAGMMKFKLFTSQIRSTNGSEKLKAPDGLFKYEAKKCKFKGRSA